jgi:RimJ/RimL family protein N-acetyltransferase
LEVAKYEAVETLRDGRQFRVRALKPDDRAGLLSAVSQSSTQSLYRRFFSSKRSLTESEITYFMDVDFVGHVALVAELEEDDGGVIIGGGRYVLVELGKAEVAFAVVDSYQQQGVGTALMRHLAAIASHVGLEEMTAEVLAENTSMLKVFEKSGLRARATRNAGIIHVTLRLPQAQVETSP